VRSNPATSPDDFDTLIERHKSQSVSYGVFGEAFNVLLETMANAIKTVKGRSDTAMTALEARVAELEARPTLDYKGIWDSETVYRRGDCVTRSGSVWHCERDRTRGILPGVGDGWRLAVKRGSDGKNAKDAR
jgi:hypothetical protein